MSSPSPAAATPAQEGKQAPETSKPAESTGSPPGSAAQAVQTGSLNNSTVTVNQHAGNTENRKYFGDAVQGLSIYAWDDTFAYTRTEEIAHAKSFACDASFEETSIATLRRDRMLFIHGEAATGKQSMALFLADCLHRTGDIEGGTLIFKPPRNNAKFDLFRQLKTRKKLSANVLIFRNILDFGNQGALEFLSNLKTVAAVAHVARELEERGIHVIFTATTGSLAHGLIASLPSQLHVTVPAPSPELLLAGINAAADAFLSRDPTLASLKAGVTPDLVRQIAEGCRTMSRVSRFIDAHLTAILRNQTTMEKALDDEDALAAWFQRCPERDLEAWIYCFALVVAHSRGGIAEVCFSEFAGLYGPIRRHILRWRGIRRSSRPLDEDALRRRVGATVYRDTAFAQDMIAFDDSDKATRLWSVLTSRFQALLISLTPLLHRLTEHDSVSVRAKAAQALGRIGVIDSPAMSLSWMKYWADSESWKERSLAGYLAQGVISTGDAVYREHLLGMLEWFASRRQYEWTAVVAYKQLAEVDMSMSMDKLRDIAETRLAPAFRTGQDIDQQLRQLDTRLARLNTPEAELIREVLPALSQFYAASLVREAELAQTFRYTLVSLCLSAGFTSVITHLTAWAHGAPGMEALTCLVFLQDEGIASELSGRKLTVVNAGGKDERITCNGILASLVDDSGAIRVFADFLKTMYAGLLNFFSLDIAAPLTRLFFEYLKDWIKESLSLPACRAAMVELITHLLRSNLRELRERAFDWLSSDPAMLESDMVQFARDARLGALSAD